MSEKISSIAAVQSNNGNFVFYARIQENELAYLFRKGPETRQGGQPLTAYTARSLQFQDNDVKPGAKTPQVTALTYESEDGSGTDQIRVYYVDGEGRLRELCNSVSSQGDLGPDWTEGSLDDAQFDANPNTPISASVDQNSRQLKIYYTDVKKDELWVAFVGLYQENWGRRQIATKY